MGAYIRPDSRWWWLCLERSGQLPIREATKVPIDGGTPEQTRDNKRLAQAIYAKRLGDLARDDHDMPRAKAHMAFAKYREWYAEHHSAHKRTHLNELSMLRQLGRTFDAYRLDKIDRRLCMEWRSMRSAQVAPATVNREKALLSHLLGTAVPQYLAVNPLAGVPQLRVPETDVRILTPGEERRLLDVCDVPTRALVLCALDTIQRLSNVVGLQRAQDHGDYITVLNPKVRGYKVPVSKRLRIALDALTENGPFYFHHLQGGTPIARRARVIHGFMAILTAAGLPLGRKSGGLSFHSLRHTGASRMLERGVDIKTVQQIGGWTDLVVLQRYLHPTDAAKVAAVETIGRE